MFKQIKEFFLGKPAVAIETKTETAPYKVPAPAETTPLPLVHAAEPVAELATHAMVESLTPVKKPRAKKSSPAAKSKSRKPRTPKV